MTDLLPEFSETLLIPEWIHHPVSCSHGDVLTCQHNYTVFVRIGLNVKNQNYVYSITTLSYLILSDYIQTLIKRLTSIGDMVSSH